VRRLSHDQHVLGVGVQRIHRVQGEQLHGWTGGDAEGHTIFRLLHVFKEEVGNRPKARTRGKRERKSSHT
jgi:hypothetical protein